MALLRSIFFLFLLISCCQGALQKTNRLFKIFRYYDRPIPTFLQPLDPAPPLKTTYNLVEELSSWKQAQVLVALATEFPDIVEAASSKDPLQVFVPTNKAFLTIVKLFFPDTPSDASAEEIASGLVRAYSPLLEKAPSLPTLKDILLYHIVAGDLSEHEIQESETLETLEGTKLDTRFYPFRVGDVDKLLNSTRLGYQIRTTNGRISFIDNVLFPFDIPAALDSINVTLPPPSKNKPMMDMDVLFKPFRTILDLASSRNDLKILTTIVGDNPVLLEVASVAKSLHVFAPTDQAFVDLVTAIVPKNAIPTLLPKGLEATLADQEELTAFVRRLVAVFDSIEALPSIQDIIAYHAVVTTASFGMLARKGPIETFDGLKIAVTKTGVVDLDQDRPDANKIASYPARNGFITLIDSVLAPANASLIIEVIADALGEN